MFQTRTELEREIDQGDRAIGAALGIEGYRSTYVQPPYAIMNADYQNFVRDRKLKVVGLTSMPVPPDSEYGPAKYHDIVQAYKTAIEKDGGGVIVLHDGCFRGTSVKEEEYSQPDNPVNRSAVPEALEELISYFSKKGFTFQIIDFPQQIRS